MQGVQRLGGMGVVEGRKDGEDKRIGSRVPGDVVMRGGRLVRPAEARKIEPRVVEEGAQAAMVIGPGLGGGRRGGRGGVGGGDRHDRQGMQVPRHGRHVGPGVEG